MQYELDGLKNIDLRIVHRRRSDKVIELEADDFHTGALRVQSLIDQGKSEEALAVSRTLCTATLGRTLYEVLAFLHARALPSPVLEMLEEVIVRRFAGTPMDDAQHGAILQQREHDTLRQNEHTFTTSAYPNPPGNTLYIGPLPTDTSDDDIMALFSRQPGYKKHCLRPKQNDTFCFVEFEDIFFATQALNDLHGAQLHNNINWGIRLCFSKKPFATQPVATTLSNQVTLQPESPEASDYTSSGLNTNAMFESASDSEDYYVLKGHQSLRLFPPSLCSSSDTRYDQLECASDASDESEPRSSLPSPFLHKLTSHDHDIMLA